MTEGQKQREKSLAELRAALRAERRKNAPMMQGSRHGYTSLEEARLLAQIASLRDGQEGEQLFDEEGEAVLRDLVLDPSKLEGVIQAEIASDGPCGGLIVDGEDVKLDVGE